nr:alpha/beta family hydrolase [Lewinella cohaerens]
MFLQGTRDTFAKTNLITEVCEGLPLAKLVIIEGGDHSFKMLKRSGVTQEEAIQKLAEETAVFAQGL